MDQETLFTSAKWNILKALAREKKSPLELAKLANTSMSNISQSLRFLELANIVKSERISNRDKGQPRVVYSIAKDNAYLIVTADGFVEKKMISIDEHKKALIKIWLYPYSNKHEEIEKTYFALKESIDQIAGIFVEESPKSSVKIIFKDNVSKKLVDGLGVEEITVGDVEASQESYYPIYDPHKISKRMIT